MMATTTYFPFNFLAPTDPLAQWLEHLLKFVTVSNDYIFYFQKTQHASDRKTIRCCCRSSGPIALKAEMQRSAYCPGEFVNIRTKLDNNSDKTMKLGVKFIQVSDWKKCFFFWFCLFFF